MTPFDVGVGGGGRGSGVGDGRVWWEGAIEHWTLDSAILHQGVGKGSWWSGPEKDAGSFNKICFMVIVLYV